MKVSELKAGQIVWECEAGHNYKLIVKEDARRVNDSPGIDGHACRCECDGQEVELFQTIDERAHHYGPRLYDSPQYYDKALMESK